MKKNILLIIFSLLFTLVLYVMPTHADEISDLQTQINTLNHELELSVNATIPLEGQLGSLQAQLASIRANIAKISTEISQKEKDLNAREDQIAQEQVLLDSRVKSYYISSYSSDPFVVIFSSKNSGDLLRQLTYTEVASAQDQRVITTVTSEVIDLLNQKQQLEKNKTSLASLQAQVDSNAKFLDSQITQAKNYQSTLNSQIAQLTAEQQSLIAAKQASLGIPLSAYTTASGCVDDRNIDPGFSPALAFFTYGVPNRVGLNQYGAWGRAKAGQSAEDILAAYYPGVTLKKDYDTGATINVNGYGSYNVEEYVKRIYEMPASWTDNNSAALKAQAVAARSYGLAHRGGICTTDSCHVFKPDPKTDNNNAWINAVNATAGWVLVDGSGNPVSTQYSSTHGGFILNLNKFDGPGGNPTSFSDLNARAYDKDSPWFYCDWGARAAYNNTAWLKSDEVADIVNTLILLQADSSTSNDLYQTDQPPPSSIPGADNWSQDRVKQELENRGITPFNAITSASISPDFNSGIATSITLSGDGRSVTFNSGDFKNRFDLRAPANIQIVGPLYNVEQR